MLCMCIYMNSGTQSVLSTKTQKAVSEVHHVSWSRQENLSILLFFCQKNEEEKCIDLVHRIENIYFASVSLSTHLYSVLLYPNLRHPLPISFILLRDILARECESDDRDEEAQESNPEIRINYEWESCLRLENMIEWYTGRCRWNNHFQIRLCHISLDQEEWDDHHRYSESENSPFPDFSTPYSWIENPSNESKKWKDIENRDEFCRNSGVLPVCLLNAKRDNKEENKSKSDADKTNRLICWFFLNQLNKFGHT